MSKNYGLDVSHEFFPGLTDNPKTKRITAKKA
jgi:hypothetical protein